MTTYAWIAVGAFVASFVSRLAEPDEGTKIKWHRASTWFTIAKELAMWAVVVAVLS